MFNKKQIARFHEKICDLDAMLKALSRREQRDFGDMIDRLRKQNRDWNTEWHILRELIKELAGEVDYDLIYREAGWQLEKRKKK